ncbi:hypothetical protein [Vibrio sp. 1180_3]|uniref:hypothetical protein n=1 Tax=Vibrio sp. 1180_3 TaxID=2528832 RepID=UPI002405034E|nr:hypothetical protein [Vibrio sp. 1180_3]MDF9399183.1 hypothetical protein [Vibrio sp. 1180_3]
MKFGKAVDLVEQIQALISKYGTNLEVAFSIESDILNDANDANDSVIGAIKVDVVEQSKTPRLDLTFDTNYGSFVVEVLGEAKYKTPDYEIVEIEKYQEDALSKLDIAGRMYEQVDLAQLIENDEFQSLSELNEYLKTQSTKLNSILKLPYEEWVMTENCCLDIDSTLAKSK